MHLNVDQFSDTELDYITNSEILNVEHVEKNHSYCMNVKCQKTNACTNNTKTSATLQIELEHNYTNKRMNVDYKKRKETKRNNEETFLTHYEINKVFSEHVYACKDKFKLATINVCGLKNRLRHEEFINECLTNDITFIQESKTDIADEDILENLLDPYGLKIKLKHRKKISKTKSGGVAIIFKKELESKITIPDSGTPDTI